MTFYLFRFCETCRKRVVYGEVAGPPTFHPAQTYELECPGCGQTLSGLACDLQLLQVTPTLPRRGGPVDPDQT